MARRPNILWLCTDQQRFDTITSLGNSYIRTPNIDKLASEGVTFTRAYSPSPVCTPSRAAFLTGRYPRTARCRQNGAHIPPDEILVTRLLAEDGYDCGLVGKLHLGPCHKRMEKRINDGYRVFEWSHHPAPDWPENDYIKWVESKGQSWSKLYNRTPGEPVWAGMPTEFHQTTWCAEKTIEFLSEERDGPWLMSFNCFDPHHAFDPPAEYLERYDPSDVPMPSFQPGELDNKPKFQRVDHQGAYGGNGMSFARLNEYQRRQVVAAYYAMIELIDDQVARILKALDETGQRDDTLVIFTSDHGEMLGDHGILLKGPYFYDCAIRVPLIMRWPGQFPAGLQSDALVELMDLAPTVLEAGGLSPLDRMQARSLMPICTGQASPNEHKDQVYCEYYNAMPGHDHSAHGTMIFDGRYKIAVYHGRDEGELYDLESDPNEFSNLWHSSEHKDLKFDLMKRCFDASIFTMDPYPPREGIF
ncbi:sulfatase [Candidatus Poribacteria bacterium]